MDTTSSNSTYTDSPFDEELTLDKIREAAALMKTFRKPFIIYSWIVPYDEVYKGEMVNKLIKLTHPEFDPEKHDGFLASERLRTEIESIFGNG